MEDREKAAQGKGEMKQQWLRFNWWIAEVGF